MSKKNIMKNTYLCRLALHAVLLLCCLTVISCSQAPTKTDYIERIVADINRNIEEDESNFFFKYVEGAHVTVKAKTGAVTNCFIETINGSDYPGYNGENVSRIYVAVTVLWDGFVDSGHSVVAVTVDHQQNAILNAEIVETSAMVNIKDPDFWRGLVEIGSLLLLF